MNKKIETPETLEVVEEPKKKKKQDEILKLAKDIKRLYQKYEPDQVKIEKNLIQIFFSDDVLELRFYEPNEVKINFHQLLNLTDVEL
jgi:hypothetical protein